MKQPTIKREVLARNWPRERTTYVNWHCGAVSIGGGRQNQRRRATISKIRDRCQPGRQVLAHLNTSGLVVRLGRGA